VITSDEEGPAVDGTRRVVDALRERGEHIAWCLVGEPSSLEDFGDNARIGRRGSLSGRLTVEGIQGHVAYPERLLNPIHAVLPVLAELAGRRWDEGHASFPPTQFQVTNIQAGTGATNIIPGELSATFNLRWSPAQTLDGLKQAVLEACERHGLRHAIEWREAALPYYTEPGRFTQLVSDEIEKATGRRPALTTGGGTSDGRFFRALGAEVIEFGVLNRSIHQLDECCAVEDLDRLHGICAGILRALFAG
jgi:succinyl-diaminopimelate desuccinylase